MELYKGHAEVHDSFFLLVFEIFPTFEDVIIPIRT